MATPSSAHQAVALLSRIVFACRTRGLTDQAAERQLTVHQAHILDHLDPLDPVRVTGLAYAMGVTVATTSTAIKKLVADGYVLRERHQQDRRVVNLRLSPAGARLREAASEFDADRVEQLLGGLSNNERELVLRGLGALAAASRRAPFPPSY